MERLFAIFFLLVVSLPGILSFVESENSLKARERLERRHYAPLPKAFPVQEFAKQFDSWAQDHFGFRSALIALHAFIGLNIYDDLPNTRYIKGKDGWYFRGEGGVRGPNYDNILDYIGRVPFSPKQLNDWTERLKRRRSIVHERGGVYLFGIGPRKSTIYPEFLPPFLLNARGTSRLDQFVSHARSALSDGYVDLVDPLLAAKSSPLYPRLYYRTDAHWNYFGAYFAYEAFMRNAQALMNGRDELQPVPLSAFRIVEQRDWQHPGFFSETTIPEREGFPILFPQPQSVYSEVAVIRSGKGFVEEGNDDAAEGDSLRLPAVGVGLADLPVHRVRYYEQRRTGGCRYIQNLSQETLPLDDLILIGDSFLQKAAPYFAAHARNTYFCRQTAAMKLPVYDIDRKSPIKTQLVVQELTESYLGLE